MPFIRTSPPHRLLILFATALFAGCHSKAPPGTAAMLTATANISNPVSLLFKPGCEWTYTGRVEWTVHTQIFETNIQWTMKVLAVAKTKNADTAIIRGFVTDLPWSEPPIQPHFTVIAKLENRIYHFSCENETAARTEAHNIAEHGVSANAEPWLDLPLIKNKRWAFNPERTDNFYCWYVENESTQDLSIVGANLSTTHTWDLVYRSNPDHQIFTIADGLGILGYEFAHHGSVASAKLTLTRLHVPNETHN